MTQKKCIQQINSWCMDFIQKMGVSHLRTDIRLCNPDGRVGYRFEITSEGLYVSSRYSYYTLKDLQQENNLVGHEIIQRWKEIQAFLIYQTEKEKSQALDLESFDVGPAYHGNQCIYKVAVESPTHGRKTLLIQSETDKEAVSKAEMYMSSVLSEDFVIVWAKEILVNDHGVFCWSDWTKELD